MKLKHFLPVAMVGILLGGCDGSGTRELAQELEHIKNTSVSKIDPLPSPSPNLPFSYTATFLRDPFQSQDIVEQPPVAEGVEKCQLPDLTRPKGFFERFDLSAFAMVGSITDAEKNNALVRVANSVYLINVGDYLGVNHGRVTSITDFSVVVLEKISDGDGGCKERPYNLELKN